MAKTRSGARKGAGRSLSDQIIDGLPSGVLAVDADGAILSANAAAAEYLQVARTKLRPGKLLDTLPHARPFLNIMEELRTARQPILRREIILTYSDDSKKEIGLSASLLEGPEDFNGAIFLFVDMTERRKLERAAELSQQLATIGELTAGVVHELRNPVSVIRGMAELLLRKLNSDDDKHRTAKLIFDEALHLEKSIAQFLGFARPFELEPAHCPADDIAERALQLCRSQARQKGVTLEYVPTPGVGELRVDPGRVAQALANLMINAIDAVGEGGYVTLSVAEDGRETVFIVEDNGPGIHLEPGEDLFQPFFTRKEDGTGLGLAIVHRIVTSHHGNVSYRNREGGGARFEVRLPSELGATW